MTYDPGADALARYPDWVIRFRWLPDDIPEAMSWARKAIVIHTEDNLAAQRCSLAHAIAHIDLEHRRTLPGIFERREELAAHRLAARRLIPIGLLADLVRWTDDYSEAAHALDVDIETMRVRLDHLHPAERGCLRRVAMMREDAV